MVTRLLVLSLGAFLGTVAALSQFLTLDDLPAEFELTLGFHTLPNGANQIQFYAKNLTSGPLKVDGSFFYVVIGAGDKNPAPTFVLNSWDGVHGTPFEPWATAENYEYATDLRGLSWTVDTDLTDPNKWATFPSGTPQLLMTVRIDVSGVPNGTWPLLWANEGATGLGGGITTVGHTYILELTDGQLSVVPEPSQVAVFGGLALLGFGIWRRARK